MSSYATLPLAMASVLAPLPDLAVSEWADRYRVIPAGTSPESGPWRTDRVPYLREPMDAISDPDVERVVMMAASQVGKTELLLCAIGFFAHQSPSPILLVQPKEDAAEAFSQERVAPMFAASPALRGLLGVGQRDATNKTMLRLFPGGLLAFGWAGSAASLASRPIRIVLNDELDRWPDSTGRDGDPRAQAVQRTSNFFNRKIVDVSTPTVSELSAIARLYEDSDRRRYHVACPRCGCTQVLEWSRVIYKNTSGVVDLDDVHYRCAHCDGRIEEREKPAMVAGGEWVPENPSHRIRGYQISALYSPWVRWRELVEEWIKATSERDKLRLQAFINLRLGEPWDEAGERITVDALEKNREEYEAEIPDGVLLLTAGVDVQDNRLEAEVVGWGLGKESWGIEYQVFPGDTLLADVWQRLDAWLTRSRLRGDGRGVMLACTCVDSGGHRTREVYEFCRQRLARNVFATKGQSTPNNPIVDKPTTSNQLRIPLYPIGADTGKSVVFSRLSITERGPGFCHFPVGRGYDNAFYLGLTAEKKVKGKWTKIRARNEPLDIRVLATAAMEIMMPDFDALAASETQARANSGRPVVAAPRRRVLSRGVEW